jgi:hypothetical protein
MDEWIKKMWSFNQPLRRMKLYHLLENGWNPRSWCSVKKAGPKTSIPCFLSLVEARENKINKNHNKNPIKFIKVKREVL